MGTINISNSKGRDAVVCTRSVRRTLRVRWLDEQGRQAASARLLKADIAHDLSALEKQAGGIEKVSDALIAGDPEVDLETFGRVLTGTSRAWIDLDGQIVHKVTQWEVLRNPDGSERERRPKVSSQPNVATELPLKWSGKLLKKKDVFNRFVFANKMQVTHVNGLTYDFLYTMAKELEAKESLLLVGAGAKSSEPLVFIRGGSAYRGFLEGRTQGDKYCLVLHLSNMELKAPVGSAEPPAAGAGSK